MDTISRKARIMELIMRTESDEILSEIEDSLSRGQQLPAVEAFDAEAWLSEYDYNELSSSVQESPEANTITEQEFWKTVEAWKQK